MSFRFALTMLVAVMLGCHANSAPPEGKRPPVASTAQTPEAKQAELLLEQITAAGEPTSAESWEKFYQLPGQHPDVTEAINELLSRIPSGHDLALANMPPPSSPWAAADGLDDYVQQHAALIEELEKTLAGPHELRFISFPERYPEMRMAQHFHFGRAMRLLRMAFVAHSRAGQGKQAGQALITSVRLLQAWLLLPDIDHLNIAVSEFGPLLESVSYYLSYAKEIDDQQLQTLADALQAIDVSQLSTRMLVGTRGLAIQSIREGNQAAVDSLNKIFGDKETPALKSGENWFHTHSADGLRLLNLYAAAVEAAQLGTPHIASKALEQEKELEQVLATPIAQRDSLTLLFGSEAANLLRWSAILDAAKSTSLAAIAAKRYYLANQKWPKKLDDLVPTYLSAVPLDPYGKGQLRYGEDRKISAVVVYSRFKNRKDDRGNVRGNLPADLGVIICYPQP